MADVLVAYIQRQICAVERLKTNPTKHASNPVLPGIDGLDDIPRVRDQFATLVPTHMSGPTAAFVSKV